MIFEVPITLFLFRRTNTLEAIIGRISEVKPRKIYLIADGGRDPKEQEECEACRKYAESLINWECEIIRNYAKKNRGVYKNIGEGAKWVLTNEDNAIFLEDDNLPEISFFYYCKELLEKYKNEKKILWICGTNYLGSYSSKYSYVFTKHMLPCGWASWSDKFISYYDGELKTIYDKNKMLRFKQSYLQENCSSKRLYKSHLYHLKRTKYLISTLSKEASWDYQMNYSVRANDFFGISPTKNQIKNIGVDNYSIHGGNNMCIVSAHCGMDSYGLQFPLKHPEKIEIDSDYEKKINKILRPSKYAGFGHTVAFIIKKILGLNKYDSLKLYLNKVQKK